MTWDDILIGISCVASILAGASLAMFIFDTIQDWKERRKWR